MAGSYEDASLPDGVLPAEWLRRIRVNIDAHNTAERLFSGRNTVLGVVVLAAIVSLGVIASSFNLTSGPARWVAIVLTLVGSVASSLQAYLAYGEKAAAHRVAARQYAALRRTLELVLSIEGSETERGVLLREARRQWDFAAGASPNVPPRIRAGVRAIRAPAQRTAAESQTATAGR
jgi:hypothetical protein